MGSMIDMASQFEVDEIYSQINYNDKPVRVSPLKYASVIKWITNQAKGIPAYIMIDMTTQETSLVRLENGIKYSESEYFMRDLNRALRFKYPTKMFSDVDFEIDDDGNPIEHIKVTFEWESPFSPLDVYSSANGIFSADLRGVSYRKAQNPLLTDPRFKLDSHLIFAGVARPYDALDEMEHVFGRLDGILPWIKEIDRASTEGRIFQSGKFCTECGAKIN